MSMPDNIKAVKERVEKFKEMISADKDHRRTKQIILNVIIAIEKGQDLVTLPNLIAVDFYINLGLKK